MTKTKIEWCDYTWNPVVGCAMNCSYCYAKEMNNRFKFIPEWNEPQFFPERLKEPYMLKKPSTIFVGSMCDLFGQGIERDWIREITKVCKENLQHTFMFLTKNYHSYYLCNELFSPNCMLGVTLTRGSEWDSTGHVKIFRYNKTYASIEPLMGTFENTDLSMFDLVIVGAMTGKNPVIPKREWIDSIKHKNIFYKSNIKKYLGETK